MTPRTKDGATLRLMDGEAHAAMIDLDTGEEIGDRRISGRVWIAFSPGQRIDLLFHADDTTEQFESEFKIIKTAARGACMVYLDGEQVMHLDQPMHLGRHSVYRIMWGTAFDLMA